MSGLDRPAEVSYSSHPCTLMGSGGPGSRDLGSGVLEGVKVGSRSENKTGNGWGPERGRRRKTVTNVIFPEPGENEKAHDLDDR